MTERTHTTHTQGEKIEKQRQGTGATERASEGESALDGTTQRCVFCCLPWGCPLAEEVGRGAWRERGRERERAVWL